MNPSHLGSANPVASTLTAAAEVWADVMPSPLFDTTDRNRQRGLGWNQHGGNSVVVVGNERTFLTLPRLPGTIAIWSAGDAAALLGNIGWLNTCRVFYWGDLDSHGFEVLSNMRKHFPNVVSILMDETTLADHNGFSEKAAATRSKARLELEPAEYKLYDRLVATGLLLEQERIPNLYSKYRLSQAICPTRALPES